jgi:hypothetical protein
MRTTELKDQSDIIRSIKAQGGHARKWASGWQMGMPDIVASFPGVGPFLMEVKQMGDARPTPNLKLEVTEKQRLELKTYSEAGFLCCIGVVLHRKRKVLFIENWWAEYMGEGQAHGPIMAEWEPSTKTYEIRGVMDRYKRNNSYGR